MYTLRIPSIAPLIIASDKCEGGTPEEKSVCIINFWASLLIFSLICLNPRSCGIFLPAKFKSANLSKSKNSDDATIRAISSKERSKILS